MSIETEKERALLKEERQSRIVELLKASKSLKSSELSEKFGVTEETIRKDLEYLAQMGLIKRTFGGAMAIPETKGVSDDIIDPPFEIRNISHKREKEQIGKLAASLIEYRDTIVLDASSTNLQVAKYMPENMEIVVISNALSILCELAKKHGITMISVGGTYRAKSTSFLGSIAEANLENFNINKAFLSGKAVSTVKGLMDTNEQEADFKRKMIQIANEAILVADHSKFDQIAYHTVCPITAFSMVISDRKIPDKSVEELKALNIGVLKE